MDALIDPYALLEVAGGANKILEAGGRRFAVTRDGYTVKEVTDYPQLPLPERVEQAPTFVDGDSLASYVQRNITSNSVMFASRAGQVCKVVIDYHGADNTPAGCEHVATWTLEESEEFQAWNRWEGQLHSQAEFIQFLEENVQDVVEPDGASLLELARDFSAIKNVNFKSSVRLDNGDRQFTYQDETAVSDQITVPTRLVLSLPIYEGEEQVTLECRFRYRMREGGLFLGYEFHRARPVLNAAFRAAITRVAENTGLVPLYGKHE